MSIRLYKASLDSVSPWNENESSGGGGSVKTRAGLVVSIGCPSKFDNIARRVKIGLTSSITILILLFRCAIFRSTKSALRIRHALQYFASFGAESQSFRLIALQKFHADEENTCQQSDIFT